MQLSDHWTLADQFICAAISVSLMHVKLPRTCCHLPWTCYSDSWRCGGLATEILDSSQLVKQEASVKGRIRDP